MFDTISNSFEIMRQCITVLRKDRELIIFPILSGAAMLLVTASFVLPLAGTDFSTIEANLRSLDTTNISQDPVAWILLFAFYFVNYFVITFFNAALISCAIVRFNGGDPTVATGLRFACKRIPQIAGWALVSATVGILLRLLENNKNFGAQIVGALAGIAWSIASYFVVPVIVVEKLGPVDAIKRSIAVIRETWGEALVTGLSLGPLQFIVMLIAASPFLFALTTGIPLVIYACLAVSIILLMTTALIFATLDSILIAALYLYASSDKVPRGFNRSFLQNAFQHKDE
jgi:hypothetical protein